MVCISSSMLNILTMKLLTKNFITWKLTLFPDINDKHYIPNILTAVNTFHNFSDMDNFGHNSSYCGKKRFS